MPLPQGVVVTPDEYLSLMQFPEEWRTLNMIPDDEWLSEAVRLYRPGHEDGSEHDRYGAFQFWLRRYPSKDQLMNLVKLSFLDPDPPMASAVRNDVSESPNCDGDVIALIESGNAA